MRDWNFPAVYFKIKQRSPFRKGRQRIIALYLFVKSDLVYLKINGSQVKKSYLAWRKWNLS